MPVIHEMQDPEMGQIQAETNFSQENGETVHKPFRGFQVKRIGQQHKRNSVFKMLGDKTPGDRFHQQ